MCPRTHCATCGESVKRCRFGCSCFMWDSPSTSPLWMKAMTALGLERPMNLAGCGRDSRLGWGQGKHRGSEGDSQDLARNQAGEGGRGKGLCALYSLSHVVDAVLRADKYEEVVMRHAKHGQATQLGLRHTQFATGFTKG